MTQARHLSFGEFRLDCRSGELWKGKREVRLQPQPAKLLVLLATRPEEVVTRTEIQKALWGEDTFVDFEHGINFCIKQIRDALGDSAEKPRYVETVPRIGYRFIAQGASDTPEESTPDRFPQPESAKLSHRGRWRFRALALAMAVLGALIAIGAWLLWTLRPKAWSADDRVPRYQLSLPRDVRIPLINYAVLAISPYGNKIAFVGCDRECQLYLRDPSAIDAIPLTGTEGAQCPFFSPDGRWIAFGAKGQLKKIDLTNGTVVTLAEGPAIRGGSWGANDTILFSQGGGGILRIPATGGDVQEVTKPDPAFEEYDHRWPYILPGGRAALFEVVHKYAVLHAGSRGHDIAVVNLETGKRRILIERGGTPKYADGHILFGRDGVLYAAPIDLARLELIGTAEPVLEGVHMWSSPGENSSNAGDVNYDISPEGTLAFNPGATRLPKRTLILLDRNGSSEPVSSTRLAYSEPQFSSDGRRIAVAVEEDVGTWGTFVIELASRAWTRVARDATPLAWMSDGRILLSSEGLRFAPIDGGQPPETVFVGDAGYASIGPEGRILFSTQAAPGRWDIWGLKVSEEPDAAPWLATSAWEQAPSFSPDGAWVAYHHSDDSDTFDIHARPYSGAGGRHQISNQGGLFPRWSREGSEIFFLSSRSLWSAAVRTLPTFASDPPRKLFELPEEIRVGVSQFYDVAPDGEHFVMIQKDPFELRPLDLVIVPGWIEEMKARLAAAN